MFLLFKTSYIKDLNGYLNMDEKELIQLLQVGDNEAFKVLVTKYQDLMLNTCYRFLQNREDAEDVAQEVFIEAFHSIKRFRGEAKISTWLYRIAISKSLDFNRRKNRKKRFAILKDIAGMEERGEQLQAGSDVIPDRQLEKKERAAILKKAVDSLPDSQKIAVTLSKYDDMSNKEISGIMKITVPAVESLLHRAKKNLEKKLSKYFEKSM